MTLVMTQGKPSRLLLQFAFPLMLSQLLQQCYSFCDTLLVGRFLGSVALTAAGSAGGLSWIPQNLVCCAIYAYGVALGQAGLYFVDAAAWIPTMLLMVIGYYAVLRKDAITS